MSIETAYICDVCGAKRGAGNHWLRMAGGDEVSSPCFLPWKEAEASSYQHVCSAQCAHKALDKWLSEEQERSHAPSTDSEASTL